MVCLRESAFSPLTFTIAYAKMNVLFGSNELNDTRITADVFFLTKLKCGTM